MHFSLSTQFGLRILLFAASVNRKTTTREIAEFYGLPLDPVRKAARRLGRLGYLDTERGQTGGLRLARPASEVALGPVIRQLEGEAAAAGNAYEGFARPHAEALRGAIGQAEQVFWERLDRVALAELATRIEVSGEGPARAAGSEDQRAA
ncbi:MAG TPA: Rrf2 family transcriptional regulator [Candidatus Saccharimonadales bacterium]|nr:Rrf2 family transcriptional regulator [Candidatus Saccharimonadales bacterium]